MKRLVLGLALAAALSAGCRPRVPPSKVLAEVNGQALTQADLEREKALENSDVKGGAPVADKDLLERLVDAKLMEEAARKDGLWPDRAEAVSLAASACEGSSAQQVDAMLRARGMTPGQWQDLVARQWALARLEEKKLAGGVKISNQEIKDYYWVHLNEFRQPEKRHLRQVVSLRRADVEKAQQELLLGDDFADVARRLSEGPEAGQGGDLGWVGQKDLPAALARVGFKLAPGKTSDLFKSPYGWHLLRLEGVNPPSAISLSEAEPSIRRAVLELKQQEAYQNWLFSLRRAAKIEYFH